MEISNFSRLAQAIAWMTIATIAYLTLAHVGLVYSIYFKLSPWLLNIGIKKYAAIEHFVAFAMLGALFCCAYPNRIFIVCFIVCGSAIGLEFMQTMTPDRHGTLVDALQKISGGLFGILTAKAALNFRQSKPGQNGRRPLSQAQSRDL